jgi:hypothetical protein
MITIYKPLTRTTAERRGRVILAQLLAAAFDGDMTGAQIAYAELGQIVKIAFLTGATIRRGGNDD